MKKMFENEQPSFSACELWIYLFALC